MLVENSSAPIFDSSLNISNVFESSTYFWCHIGDQSLFLLSNWIGYGGISGSSMNAWSSFKATFSFDIHYWVIEILRKVRSLEFIASIVLVPPFSFHKYANSSISFWTSFSCVHKECILLFSINSSVHFNNISCFAFSIANCSSEIVMNLCTFLVGE